MGSVCGKMPLMGKKKSSAADRHKPRRQVGIPEALAVVLDEQASKDLKSLTDLVKEICLEYARTKGWWPPVQKKPAP